MACEDGGLATPGGGADQFRSAPIHRSESPTGYSSATSSWSAAPIRLRRTYAATMLVVSPLSRVGDGGSSGNLVLPVEIDKIPHPAKSRC